LKRSARRSQHRGREASPVIDTFDDEAFEILSNIPDQESIWVCDQKWERSAENGTNQAQVERSRRQRNELDDNDRGYTGSSPPAQIVVSTEL
jgi:hypothetical protein